MLDALASDVRKKFLVIDHTLTDLRALRRVRSAHSGVLVPRLELLDVKHSYAAGITIDEFLGRISHDRDPPAIEFKSH